MRAILLALVAVVMAADTATRNNQMTGMDVDDPLQRIRKDYPNDEKDKWINYDKKNLTAGERKRREEMWTIDFTIVKIRGALQGWRRGFYKEYNYKLQEQCLGRDTTKYIYYIGDEFKHFEIMNIISLVGLFYNIYYTFDFHCSIEQWMYDLSNHCFDNNCEPEQLLKNEMGHVFQVTGALNALAAIYYEEEPKEDQH